MSFEFRDAIRRDVPLLILLAGGTGSGKTESALRLATGIADGGLIVGIDTERGRMLHKADDYTFKHAEFEAPFSPERYAEALRDADALNPKVIVLDSGSHVYDGEGGYLDIQETEFEKAGRKESARIGSWREPSRRHKLWVRELLRMRSHVIVCHRAEDKIEVGKDADGKTVIREKASLVGYKGWIPICHRRLPFEATVNLLLLQDAPGVPKPIKLEARHAALVPLDEQLSEKTGRRLAEWAAGAKTGPGEEGSRQTGRAERTPDGGESADTPAVHDEANRVAGASDTFASEDDVRATLELAAQAGDDIYAKTVDALAKERDKHGGRVRVDWLRKLADRVLLKAKAAA